MLGAILPFMGAIILLTYFAKPYRIANPPMVPMLKVGDRIVIDPGRDAPKIGDIVVSHPAAGAEAEQQCGARHPSTQACPRPPSARDDVNVIKRVVAGPGDRLSIEDGQVVMNGRRQDESFAQPCGGGEGCSFPTEVTIPAGHYFMMGDNRGSSDDSRFWGPVPEEWIIGEAFGTYWPPKRIGLL
jgi:signal peptidase I